MTDSLRVRAISLVPPSYRPLVKQFFGTRKNTLVYKVPQSGSTETSRVGFTFHGHTLVNPLQLMRRFGSDIVGKVQALGWKIFPKDSRGNFLIYVDPDEIKLESDNNLVYRSKGVTTTNSPGAIFIRTTNLVAKDSEGSTFCETTNSHALQSPETIYKKSTGCTTTGSTGTELSECRSITTSGSKTTKFNVCLNSVVDGSTNTEATNCSGLKIEGSEGITAVDSTDLTVKGTTKGRIIECTAAALDQSIDILLERCARVKTTLCKRLHVSDTTDKDLKNLRKRRVTSNELQLKWYEGIPVIGPMFKTVI